MATENVNSDLSIRIVERTGSMAWTASPSGSVFRKRVHLVGSAESGQVTSVVRYEPNSKFPHHGHPDGEEIYVLSGVFSDEHGDWPAGTYILNPEGVSHAPFSVPGCTLFVKLRQYPGIERKKLALATDALEWKTTSHKHINEKALYQQQGFDDQMVLQRWAAKAELGRRQYPLGAEIFVIEGRFNDEFGQYSVGDWLRLPRHFSHSPSSESGCVIYLKQGGFSYLRQQ